MVAAPTRPKAEGYGVQIGDDWFRVAPSTVAPINIYTRDILAGRTQDSASPEENVLDVGFTFSRSNLTGGEGLDYYPRQGGEEPQARDKTRFWDSADLLMDRPSAGQPGPIRLAYDTELWNPDGSAVDMAVGGGKLYLISGTEVQRFDDLSDTTPEDTDDLGVTLVQVVASDDGQVAVLDDTGDIWLKGAKTNTYLQIYDAATEGPTTPALAIWLVKGRVMAYCSDDTSAAAGLLLEIGPVIQGTPAAPTEGSHTYNTVDSFDAVVLDVVDAGHAIVACLDDGSLRSYILQTDAAGDTPILTVRATTTMPRGDTPYRMAWTLGAMLILAYNQARSELRVYSGLVLDSRFEFAVGELQLLRTWAQTAEEMPAWTERMVTTRDSIYFWVNESGTGHNTWRYDLVTQGLFRERAEADSFHPLGMAVFENDLVWISDGDVYRESDNRKASGYVITPNITHGLNTPLNWTSFIVEVDNLEEAGTSVELYRTTDPDAILDPNSANWVLVSNLSDPVHSGVEHTRVKIQANSLALMLVLHRGDDPTETPEVTGVTSSAVHQRRNWIAEIPINISDTISAPYRMPLHIPEYGDTVYERLLDLQGLSRLTTVLDPPVAIRGTVYNIATPVTYRTNRGSQGRYAMVQILGVRAPDAEGAGSTIGGPGMGVATMGVGTMGVGE